jgi:hypothetical protein
MTRYASILFAIVFLAAFVDHSRAGLVPREWNGTEYACKCYFDDQCWPIGKLWSTLNTTVDGNLRIHVPPESVCHNTFSGPFGDIQTYDQAACADLQASYAGEQWT